MKDKPLPPEVLVSALQDKVHFKEGRTRPAKATRDPVSEAPSGERPTQEVEAFYKEYPPGEYPHDWPDLARSLAQRLEERNLEWVRAVHDACGNISPTDPADVRRCVTEHIRVHLDYDSLKAKLSRIEAETVELLCRVRDSLNGTGAWAGAQKCVMAYRALLKKEE